MNEYDFDQAQLSSDRTSDLPSSLKERLENFEDFEILSSQRSFNRLTCTPEQKKKPNRNEENFFIPIDTNQQQILQKYQINVEQIKEVDSNLERSQITKFTPKLSAFNGPNLNSEFEFKKSHLDSDLHRISNDQNIQNSMHFIEVKNQTVSQSQEFRSFEKNQSYKRRISNNHQLQERNNLKNKKLELTKKLAYQNNLKNFESPQKEELQQQASISTHVPQESTLKSKKDISKPFAIFTLNKQKFEIQTNEMQIQNKQNISISPSNMLKYDFDKENQKQQNFKKQKLFKDKENILIYKKQFLKKKRSPVQVMKSMSIYKIQKGKSFINPLNQKFDTLKNSKSISRDFKPKKVNQNFSENLNQSVEENLFRQKKIHIKSIFSKKKSNRKKEFINKVKKSQKINSFEKKDKQKLKFQNVQNLAMNYELKNQKQSLKKYKSQERKQKSRIYKSTFECNLYTLKNFCENHFFKKNQNKFIQPKLQTKNKQKQDQKLESENHTTMNNKKDKKKKNKKRVRKIKILYKKQC